MHRLGVFLAGLAVLVTSAVVASFVDATKVETRWVLARLGTLSWRFAVGAVVFLLSLTPAGCLVESTDGPSERGASGPSYSRDGAWVAFTSDRSGKDEVYVAPVGAPAARITHTEHGVGALAWSPDGSTIVFSALSGKDWPDRESSGLFVVNRDGAGLRRLTVGEDFLPCWAADGKTIVFERGFMTEEIRAVDADGTNERRLMRSGSMPACSPTQPSIAFATGESDIGVLDLKRGNRRTVAELEGAVEASSPTWSPNGRQIAFEVWRPWTEGDPEIKEGPWAAPWYLTDLYRIDADGTGLKRLTENTVGDRWPDWLPDGRIFFVSNRAGPDDLTNSDASAYYVMKADGSGVEVFPWDPAYS